MNLSADLGSKGKNILILGEKPAQGLDDTTLRAEAMYPINFTQPNECFVLTLFRKEGRGTFTNVRTSPQNFLTFSFDPFATLV